MTETDGDALSEIRVFASFTLKDAADAKKFRAKSKVMVAASQKEKGCLYYELLKDRDDGSGTQYVMWEVWGSRQELEAHWETAHFTKYVSWVVRKSDVVVSTFAAVPLAVPPVSIQKEVSKSASEVRVLASITLKDAANAPTLLEKSEVVVAASQEEQGCLYYGFHMDLSDDSGRKYVMWEEWNSVQELEAHWETAHFEDYVGWVEPRSDVVVRTFVLARGPRGPRVPRVPRVPA